MEAAAKPTRLPAPARREQLLDAARELAGERGFHALTIDAIARAAGVSRPIVYGHFGDLHGVIAALLEREEERAKEQLAALIPRPDGRTAPRELLLGALRAFLDAVAAEPVRWRLVLMPPEGAPGELRERIAEVRSEVTSQLAAIAPVVLGQGGDAPPDPELTALSIQAVAEEAARLLLERPAEFPVERLVAHAGWLLEALGVPG